MRLHRALCLACALAVSACATEAPPVAMPPPHDPNAYPNPYHVEEGWAKLGRKFGISAVDMDPDGKHVPRLSAAVWLMTAAPRTRL
jgi:hypothetical protein